MSADSYQKKQELLILLAESRLRIIEGGEKLAQQASESTRLLGSFRTQITSHPLFLPGCSLVGGFLGIKILRMLFSRRSRRGEVVSRRGIGMRLFVGVGKLLLLVLAPVAKSLLQDVVTDALAPRNRQ